MSAFFTFPLALLAMPVGEKEILELIVCCGMQRAGAGGNASEIDGARIGAWLEGKSIGYEKCDRHDQLVRGAIICNVSPGWIPSSLTTAEKAESFVTAHERVHGKCPLVFISAQLFWDCRDGTIKFREFSTLCAINSVIGFKKTPVLIRRGMIIARQLGYKTAAVMAQELPRLKLKPARKALTTQQLRDALDRLENRQLIARCQPKPRSVFFSTALDFEALRQSVKELLEKKARAQSNRESDREFFSENHNGTTTEPLKKESDEKEPLKKKEPDENHNGTTTGTVKGTTTGTTEIKASKEEPLNKCFKQERFKQERGTAPAQEIAEIIPMPEEPAPRFHMPSTAEAEEHAMTVHKAATGDMGATWWHQHGADSRWLKQDWKRHCFEFVLKQVGTQRKASA